MRTEVKVVYEEDIKKNGYPIFYFYPQDFLKDVPEKQTKLYNTILERTGDERLAASVEKWARNASVNEKIKNKYFTATVDRW